MKEVPLFLFYPIPCPSVQTTTHAYVIMAAYYNQINGTTNLFRKSDQMV